MIQVKRISSTQWGIVSTSYSMTVRNVCKETPGMIWSGSQKAWLGYPDSVAVAFERIRKAGCRIVGKPPEVVAEPILTLPIATSDLRKYQIQGVSFAVAHAAEGVIIADDVGLGKTLEGIRAARAFKGHTLIVCPAFLRGVWEHGLYGDKDANPPRPAGWPEAKCVQLRGVKPIAEWDEEEEVRFHTYEAAVEAAAERGEKLKLRKPKPRKRPTDMVDPSRLDGVDVAIINYEILYAWEDVLLAWGVDNLLFDEAHYLQSDRARRSKSAKKIAEQSKRRIALTATPMTSRPKDIWNVVDTISPGRLGKQFSFYVRYCCERRTPIWMGDYTFKAIGDVKVGDEVVGWHQPGEKCPKCAHKASRSESERCYLCRGQVTNVITRRAQCVEVTLASGRKVICTPDHLWRYFRRTSGSQGRFEFGHPKEGMEMCFVAEPAKRLPATEQYKYGYVMGALAGDGHVGQTYYPSGAIRHTSINLRVKSKDFADRFEAFARDCNFSTSRPGVAQGLHAVYITGGDEIYQEVHANEHRPRTHEEWRGWIAGIYDAEGCGFAITQSETANPEVLTAIKNGLRALGFNYKVYPNRRGGSGVVSVYIIGGWRELLRFYNTVQPVLKYKVDRHIFGAAFQKSDRVVGVRPVGVRQVVSLTTTLGNYIAGGYSSKNCNAHQEQVTPEKVVWKFDGVSNAEELAARLKFFMIRRTKSDVALELPSRQRQIIYVDVPRASRVPMHTALSDDRAIRRALELAADAKIPQVVEAVQSYVDAGHKIVVFTHRKSVAHAIAQDLLAAGTYESSADVAVITGEVAHAKRAQIVKRQPIVTVATMDSIGVGVDLSYADVGAFAEYDYVPLKIVQAEGRLHRFGQKRSVLFLYFIGNGTIDDLIIRTVIDKMGVDQGIVGKRDDGVLADLNAGKKTPAEALRELYESIKAGDDDDDEAAE